MAQPTNTINPLEPMFSNQRIKVADFYNPFDANHRNKTFIDCEFIGPSVVAFINSNIELDKIVDCEFVEVANNAQVRNVIGFDRATVRRGRFYRMTLLFPPADAARLRAANPNLVWLTPPPPAQAAPNEPQGGPQVGQAQAVRQGA
jgi:hypothetical protein